jgi:hypothetical protein
MPPKTFTRKWAPLKRYNLAFGQTTIIKSNQEMICAAHASQTYINYYASAINLISNN